MLMINEGSGRLEVNALVHATLTKVRVDAGSRGYLLRRAAVHIYQSALS